MKINNTIIKTPTEFRIERYNLTKAGRLANGKMTMELIAKKRKFNLKYNVISGSDLNAILNEIDGNNLFFTFTYPDEHGNNSTATVYAGEIPSTLYRADGDKMWKDVEINLIEQ